MQSAALFPDAEEAVAHCVQRSKVSNILFETSITNVSDTYRDTIKLCVRVRAHQNKDNSVYRSHHLNAGSSLATTAADDGSRTLESEGLSSECSFEGELLPFKRGATGKSAKS